MTRVFGPVGTVAGGDCTVSGGRGSSYRKKIAALGPFSIKINEFILVFTFIYTAIFIILYINYYAGRYYETVIGDGMTLKVFWIGLFYYDLEETVGTTQHSEYQ